MNDDNIDIYENDFNERFEDIEQMLMPQCEFKASDALKESVLEKAREEVAPRRTIKMWHWVAAACVTGVLTVFLMSPKSTDNVVEDDSVIAKVEPTHIIKDEPKEDNLPPEPVKDTFEPQTESKSIPKTAVSPPTDESEPEEEPVQMSEETKMELLMAYLSTEEQTQMEINPEEEIRKLRQRGERLLSMCKRD